MNKVTLADWIWELGDEEVARRTGKPKGSISQYRLLNRSPSVKLAKLFMHMSDGQLDWESIYGPANEIHSTIAIPEDRSKTKSRPLEKRKGVPVRG